MTAITDSRPAATAPFPTLPLGRVVGCEFRGRQRWLLVEAEQSDGGTLLRLAQAIHDRLPSDCALLLPKRGVARILACLQVLAFGRDQFRWVLADMQASAVLADLGPAQPVARRP